MDEAGSKALTDLVARAKLGNRKALEDLLRRSIPVVRGVVRAYVGQTADAQDLHQVVLLEIWKSIRSIRDPTSYPKWLANLIRHRALDFVRSTSRDAVVGAYEAGVRLEDLPTAERMDSFLELVWRERMSEVTRTIAALPAKYREVVALRILDGLEPEEIVARTGRKPGTVRAQLSRGLTKLRKGLHRA